jgi:hypothetical protein
VLAAKISTTKDSIDDGGQYKSVLVEDPPANISQQSTELIQQHIEPRTSSNNQNYYLSSNEKELAAVPYSSNINTDSNSLQQYFTEIDGYLDNDDKNSTPSTLPQYHYPSAHNIIDDKSGSTKRRNSLTDDKKPSPKKDALSRLKSFHFTKRKSKNLLLTSDKGESLPSSPRSPRLQPSSMNRFIEKNRATLQTISAFQKYRKSSDMSSRRSFKDKAQESSGHPRVRSSGHSNPSQDSNQSFEFDQMQKALSETGSESTHSSSRSGEQRHRQSSDRYTPTSSGEQSRAGSTRQHSQRHNYQQQQQPNEIQVVSSAPFQQMNTVTEANGANNVQTVPSSSNGNKKEKYKGLWGKVGKHGMSQAAATRGSAESEVTASSSPTARVPSKKWDQVLNPLITKQMKQQDKKLAKKQSKAEINYHMQQQQMQQAVQMPQQSASGGSYVFAETSGTGTVECDCGDDCCPNCNLLLQMSGSGW